MHGIGIGSVLGAFFGGAVAMYFFDDALFEDARGRRRRALVRDKAMRAEHTAKDALVHVERDFENRTRGVIARLGSWLERAPVDDEVLVQRVRARLGHLCSHPSTVEVHAKGDGCIELKGPVLASEKLGLLAGLALVPGVRMIDDDLEVHATADVPGLQGAPYRASFLQRHWNPTTRTLLGAAGSLWILRGLLERGVRSPLHTMAGGAMLAAAFVEREHDQPHPKPTAPGSVMSDEEGNRITSW